ncbi:dihydroorotate dehydrogenase [Striga asiatica]|uniref:Dihydroorotate dehydrogenase n=1 Tax=Striga asiatica TaxID=4170 RepID=A0A5A7QD43_STRAF|nr:dihydroorotate dehydrogenase [Striga asiatica]
MNGPLFWGRIHEPHDDGDVVGDALEEDWDGAVAWRRLTVVVGEDGGLGLQGGVGLDEFPQTMNRRSVWNRASVYLYISIAVRINRRRVCTRNASCNGNPPDAVDQVSDVAERRANCDGCYPAAKPGVHLQLLLSGGLVGDDIEIEIEVQAGVVDGRVLGCLRRRRRNRSAAQGRFSRALILPEELKLQVAGIVAGLRRRKMRLAVAARFRREGRETRGILRR